MGRCTAHVRFRGEIGHPITSDNRVYRKFGKAVCKRLPARWSFRQIDEVRLCVAA
jgi:hypothetical protein